MRTSSRSFVPVPLLVGIALLMGAEPGCDDGSGAGESDGGTISDASTGPSGGGSGGAGTCGGTIEQELLRITNEERARNGRSAFRCDEALTRAAWKHSNDMCRNDYFSHTGRDGSQPWDRARAEGATFTTAGENIARGQRTPADVHASWMNSSGHRANILSGNFGRIGIGYDECGGRPLWTQVFTN